MSVSDVVAAGNHRALKAAPAASGPPNGRVLVATREPGDREGLLRILEHFGLQAVPASTVIESRELLSRVPISMVVCEDKLDDGSYREILGQVGGIATRVPVVVFSHLADWDRYLEAMRSGAFDYLRYPCSRTELESVVSLALRTGPLFP